MGGRGGGRQHMAQAGAEDRSRMMEGLRCGQDTLEDKMTALDVQFQKFDSEKER